MWKVFVVLEEGVHTWIIVPAIRSVDKFMGSNKVDKEHNNIV